MFRVTISLILPLSVHLLTAADPSWKTKDVSQWSVDEAQQVLANSPWVKKAVVKALPQRSEAQLRDAGRMGMSKGAGLAALDPSILTGLGGGKRLVPKAPKRQMLPVRWESAAPIRGAEVKTSDERAPAWNGNYYAIAVYDVPGLEDQKSLPVELRKSAFLRRKGRKDLKPVRAELLFDGDLATIVYLFPRSDEITREDKFIWFAAQIGQLFVEQSFDAREMQHRGKLEL